MPTSLTYKLLPSNKPNHRHLQVEFTSLYETHKAALRVSVDRTSDRLVTKGVNVTNIAEFRSQRNETRAPVLETRLRGNALP